jgi:hypothetical protein
VIDIGRAADPFVGSGAIVGVVAGDEVGPTGSAADADGVGIGTADGDGDRDG